MSIQLTCMRRGDYYAAHKTRTVGQHAGRAPDILESQSYYWIHPDARMAGTTHAASVTTASAPVTRP